MRLGAQGCVGAAVCRAAHVAPLLVGKMAVDSSILEILPLVGFQNREPLAILLSSYATLVDAPFMHPTQLRAHRLVTHLNDV